MLLRGTAMATDFEDMKNPLPWLPEIANPVNW